MNTPSPARFRCLLCVVLGISMCRAALAQNVLDVSTLTKYVDPLPRLLNNTISPTGTMNGDPLYEVGISQFQQQLHSQLAPTTVWGYDGVYPGPAFDVQRDQTIHVQWRNELVDATEQPLSHFLPYDTSVHGAGPQFPQARVVTHLHGGVTAAASDGFSEHWVSPDENAAPNGLGGPAGNALLTTYTNNQRAAGMWYHDHAMGITRLNVYAGLAGPYLVRDAQEAALGLPSGDYEAPLIFQDRSFYENGELFYPDGGSPSNPSQVPFFLADANVVNGMVWPFLEVEPRKYRFRMLNGANSRSYDLSLEPDPGAAVTGPVTLSQIGTDGGFLTTRVDRLNIDMAPADRADVVVDFSQFNVGDTLRLMNSGLGAAPGTTDEVMQFQVVDPNGADTSNLPTSLSSITRYNEADAVRTRTLELIRTVDGQGRPLLLLDGSKWSEPITETVVQGELEIWEIVNATPQSHPIHLHLEAFQVLDRTGTFGDIPLEDYEQGWEDTFSVGAGETVRFMVKFDQYTGTFVWHCHILEHEDYEMMRPFRIVRRGDFDGNNLFECADVDALVAEIAAGTDDADYDLNRDGAVDNSDLSAWLAVAGAENLPSGAAFLPGDANLDGAVNGDDFRVWNQNKFTQSAAWCLGDFNADGSIDGADLLVWNAHKFQSAAPQVPEPTAWLLCVLAAMAAWNQRRAVPTDIP